MEILERKISLDRLIKKMQMREERATKYEMIATEIIHSEKLQGKKA